jgi:hypothetical protein
MDDAVNRRMRPANAPRIDAISLPPDKEDIGPVADDTPLLSPLALPKRQE